MIDLFAQRTAGLLLHPTCLPGPHGTGDLGPAAHDLLGFLSAAGLSAWQMLPIGPPGRSFSPYDCSSSFAGSPMLVSLERLADSGWLTRHELRADPGSFVRSPGRADLRAAAAFRLRGLAIATDRAARDRRFRERLEAFREREAGWLADHALFAALRGAQRGRSWTRWDEDLRVRRRPALKEARRRHAERIMRHEIAQLFFDDQWRSLRDAAARLGIALVGDLPIYVALESADVWSRPELFDLDPNGRPRTVAGVPPDTFSRNGQLWGNPTYLWRAHARERYAWWLSRVERALALFDNVRLDHFIGFHRGWMVPAGARTARRGRWRQGPGAELFQALADRLGPVHLIAEDLGLLTPEVHALRERFEFRGMRLLQCAFDGATDNPNLPHNLPRNVVLYTGTHDNKTMREWITQTAPDRERRSRRQISADRRRALRYLGSDGREFHWDAIQGAIASVADTVVIPAQDILGLGREARFNRPGTARDNWNWRMAGGALGRAEAARLAGLVATYGRGGPRLA